MLAREVFGAAGTIFFAGGPGTLGVQVLNPESQSDPLHQFLADLFDPRDGRQSSYRPARVASAGAASLENLRQALKEDPAAPLLLYVAGHGEQGESPAANRVLLWGGYELTPTWLANELEAGQRDAPVRVVVTACHSGGFAELAFVGAAAARGPTTTDRCGFFAAPWDDVASGCDPNPNRRTQEGYGLHFLNALRRCDRHGDPMGRSAVDFDGDGRVSLLEAHTRARIAARSIDQPNTTSERWLREHAPREGSETPVSLAEEDAVIAELGRQLGLAAGVDAARTEEEQWAARVAALDDRLRQAQADLDEAAADLAMELLERWPVLDDPWHPDFAASFTEHHDTIEELVRTSRRAFRYRSAQQAADEVADMLDETRVRRAIVRRLVRAYETRALARRLAAVGGPAWERYQRFVACERFVP